MLDHMVLKGEHCAELYINSLVSQLGLPVTLLTS